tara:strand:- start:378 stop:1250 length:873 start_codon:yes stop_codon:yes gene_type:complete
MKTMDDFAEEVGDTSFVSVRGGGTRWDLGGSLMQGTSEVVAPKGVINFKPEEMIVQVGAGTKLNTLQNELNDLKQEVALAGFSDSTVGGSLAVGSSSHRRARIGAASDVLLQAECVGADGQQFVAGGPTVKNVTGYDLCRLLVSSLGTLALMGVVTLRTRPKPEVGVWLKGEILFEEILRCCYRPASVLKDASRIFLLIEGYEKDVEKECASLEKLGMSVMETAPIIPPMIKGRLGENSNDGLLDLQTGAVYSNTSQGEIEVPEGVKVLSERIKNNFDPTGRLNPGRRPY